MAIPTNALNWFELPVIDFARAKAFYERIFEVELSERQMGPRKMGFLPYDFTRGVGGAIVEAPDFIPSTQGSLIYLNAGPDLSVVLDRIEPAGGKVLMGKTEVGPNLGFHALFLDPEGNRVALHSMA